MTRILLATLTSGLVSAHYAGSKDDLLYDRLPDVDIKPIFVRGGPRPAHQRNVAVRFFLALEQPANGLLFIDADIKFTKQDVKLLIDAKQDIVGGRYYGYSELRNETFPTWKPLSEKPPETGLIECSHVGTGFMLISYKVLDTLNLRLGKAWPFADETVEGLDVGEDVTFCHRARLAGFKVFLNADARVFHDKSGLI